MTLDDIIIKAGRILKGKSPSDSLPVASKSFNDLVGFLKTKFAILDTEIASSGSNYTEYHAMLSQTGINPPVAVNSQGTTASAFVDTIDGEWIYLGEGIYDYTKVGAFININKVSIEFGAAGYQWSDVVVTGFVVNDDTLRFFVGVRSTYASGGTVTLTDGKLDRQPVTIKVYNE